MSQPTAAQRKRWGRVAALGCAACVCIGICDTPAEIHHVRQGRLGKRGHDAVIPLCPPHHRIGPWAIHNMSRDAWAQYTGKSEIQMLEDVDRAIPHAV